MRRRPTIALLTITLALAASALPSVAKDKDDDASASDAKPAPVVHHRLFYMGSCTTLGYSWPGIAFPISDGPPSKRVTAYICMRQFRFAPHDWP